MQTFILAFTMGWTAITIAIFLRLWTVELRYDLVAVWVFILLVGGALLILMQSRVENQIDIQPSTEFR